MVQEPDNSNRLTAAKLASSNSNNRVTELSPVPLNKVTVEPRHQLAQELDRVTALKEELELPSSNKAMVVLKLEVLAELDKGMVEHPAVNRSQPTLTTQMAMATNLLHPLHHTNRRFELVP